MNKVVGFFYLYLDIWGLRDSFYKDGKVGFVLIFLVLLLEFPLDFYKLMEFMELIWLVFRAFGWDLLAHLASF